MGRFICADGYATTYNSAAGANMFAYCLNNPVNYVDDAGEVALAATLGGIALWKMGVVFLGAVATIFVIDTLVKNPPRLPNDITPETNPEEKAEAKSLDALVLF